MKKLLALKILYPLIDFEEMRYWQRNPARRTSDHCLIQVPGVRVTVFINLLHKNASESRTTTPTS